VTDQQKSINAAIQAEQLLQQTTEELKQAETHEQIEKARKQLRKVQGMLEQSEMDLYNMNTRDDENTI
jgi:hypothetical protein